MREIAIMPAISSAIPLDAPILDTRQPLLRASGLVMRYNHILAVDHVDLDVYPGEVLGIVGESGSGKSTVLRLLNLEELPNEGTYSLNIAGLEGKNLFELERYNRREVRTLHIGIVYQNPYLGLRMRYTSSGNVAERLLITGERSFNKLRQAAKDSLSASEFPLDRMDDAPKALSGGMQQRVQVAKANRLRLTKPSEDGCPRIVVSDAACLSRLGVLQPDDLSSGNGSLYRRGKRCLCYM